MNFYRPKYVSCMKTESGEHTRCPRGRGARPPPSWRPRVLPGLLLIFLNIPKRRNIALKLFWSRFTYRTTYLFLFGVWNVPKSVPYVFLWGYGFNNIGFNIYGITWDIMFDSLTVHHSRIGAFSVVDLDSSGAINFFDDIWSFPFREKFSCKESETKIVQKELDHLL